MLQDLDYLPFKEPHINKSKIREKQKQKKLQDLTITYS